MGGVDIADQLRGVYRIDRFVRNRKWWWSLLFWGIGVLLTNAYKLYISVCADEGVTPIFKEQYKFRTAIAEYWINPDRITKELHKGTRKRKFDNKSVASLSCMSPITNPLSFSSPCMNIDSATAGSRKRQDKEHHKRQKPFTDDTLSERGSLCCRLDHSLDHFCEPPLEKSVYCGLNK